MALSLTQCYESGNGQLGLNAEEIYAAIVTGTAADNADDPVVAVLYAIPYFSGATRFGNIINELSWERIAPFTWRISGRYVNPFADRQTDDSSFSFTTAGGTQHITHSLQTVGAYAPSGKTPPNHQGSIGVSGNSVEGVDIDVSQFNFRTTFYASAATITTSYVSLVKSLSNKVNADVVTLNVDGVQQTFQPGELRFLNAEGSKRRGYGDWELTLNWSAIPNLQNISIGPINGIDKNGWDYLWVDYETSIDTGANAAVQVPRAVYVERVYTYLPLSPLLLPTGYVSSSAPNWLRPQVTDAGGIVSG